MNLDFWKANNKLKNLTKRNNNKQQNREKKSMQRIELPKTLLLVRLSILLDQRIDQVTQPKAPPVSVAIYPITRYSNKHLKNGKRKA
jgi:hypothetical protein